MTARQFFGIVIGVALAAPAMVVAQAHHHRSHHGRAPSQHASPYRDQHAAGVRGLSTSEIDDLSAGRGMGLARAAELNGYPGPRHVLDAAADGSLALSPEQRQAVERVFADMERAGGSHRH